MRGHYQRAFNLKDFSSAERRYRGLHRKENEPGSTQCQRILDEVLSFRGSSPFQVGVWDTTITPHSFFGYDALVIAQSSTFAIAEPADWQAALDARYAEEGKRTAVRDEWKHGLQQGDLPVVLEVEAFQSERDILVLGLDDWERLKQLGMNQVVLLKGLSIKQPTSETIKQLNNVLRKQAVVAWISRIKPVELRKKLGLPPFFPLYPLQDVNESNPSYTLALGHAALLVEAEAIRLGKRKDRNNDAENAPIFC